MSACEEGLGCFLIVVVFFGEVMTLIAYVAFEMQLEEGKDDIEDYPLLAFHLFTWASYLHGMKKGQKYRAGFMGLANLSLTIFIIAKTSGTIRSNDELLLGAKILYFFGFTIAIFFSFVAGCSIFNDLNKKVTREDVAEDALGCGEIVLQIAVGCFQE